MDGRVLALAGGVGGAKLALGLSRVLTPAELTIAVNTGDDDEFFGLHVSPDLDTVMYTLAGIANPETGWGLRDDTFQALHGLREYGAPGWFGLGDKDLATHIRRTELLRGGATLSQVTASLGRALGVAHDIVPMSDDPVRTRVSTDKGDLPFQEYFVRLRCEPRVTAVHFDGASDAQPSAGFAEALADASAVVFCPSNPFLSIAPILAVPGVRDAIEGLSVPRAVVSPIVGGQALRGPAAKMLAELGHDVSSLGIARQYQGLCDAFVIDGADEALAPGIESLGMEVHVTNTVMTSDEDKIRLARSICRIVDVPRPALSEQAGQ